MTEDEAEKTWCPHSRKYHSNGSFNRSSDDSNKVPTGCYCMGSRCMAWRWVKDELVEFVANGKTIPNYKSEHGYCGLAGPI